MRTEMIWDEWLEYDEDGFSCGIRSDAPENVKKAYEQYIAEQEKEKKSGCVMR